MSTADRWQEYCSERDMWVSAPMPAPEPWMPPEGELLYSEFQEMMQVPELWAIYGEVIFSDPNFFANNHAYRRCDLPESVKESRRDSSYWITIHKKLINVVCSIFFVGEERVAVWRGETEYYEVYVVCPAIPFIPIPPLGIPVPSGDCQGNFLFAPFWKGGGVVLWHKKMICSQK